MFYFIEFQYRTNFESSKVFVSFCRANDRKAKESVLQFWGKQYDKIEKLSISCLIA